jgi:Helix-turn-helix domain
MRTWGSGDGDEGSVRHGGQRMTPRVPLSTRLTERHCMARGRKTALTIRLTPAQRQTLLTWQRATTLPAGWARRGRMLLLVAAGVPITHVAATVGISRPFVYRWVQRFLTQGLAGLADKPGRGFRRVSSPLGGRNSTTPARDAPSRRGGAGDMGRGRVKSS